MEETKTETIKILAVFTVTWRLYKTASMEKKRRLLNLWGSTLIVTRGVAWETKQPRPQGETDYILRRHRNVVWEPKWRLRNERRNFILMTWHYPDVDLESASDWLKQISRNQSEVTPRSDTSLVLNFCALFSDVIWRGNHWWRREMSAVFLGYLQGLQIRQLFWHYLYVPRLVTFPWSSLMAFSAHFPFGNWTKAQP